MEYCSSKGGVCPACGIAFHDSAYERECRPRSYWIQQHEAVVASHASVVNGQPAPEYTPTHGPGTELKKLLAKVGITATPDCSCNARAAEMDRQGVEWCEENLETIVGWLREQAHARGLPFIDAAGRMLVRRAIKQARKNKIDP